MNITQECATKLRTAWDSLSSQQREVQHRGPKGGRNARHIPGWSSSPHQTVTKACHGAGIPTMQYWSGSCTTPSTAIPTVLYDTALDIMREIKKQNPGHYASWQFAQ